MPRYEFAGPDPIDHFHFGRIHPGDTVEVDEPPGPAWVAKRRTKTPEPSSDTPDTPEEV